MARATDTPEAAAAAPAAEASDTQKKRAAYAAAEQRLREKYADEFKALVNEEATNRGVTYTFRKTEEERAAQTLADLLAKHPNLAAQVNPQAPPPLPPA